ncbi:primosomal protein N' [Acuticoccus sp.]|uniref:primosomal protein N' n=1 Tax=Acuticoccus sp. TaxID=1904378 RepID=UPI003B5200BA
MTAARRSVLLPHRLGLLTYTTQEPFAPGDVVAVPLGGRTMVGVVWDDPADEAIEEARLRPIKARASRVRVQDELRRFVDFAARYTMTPRGAVLKLVLRNGEGLAEPPVPKVLVPTGAEPPRWTPARRAVVDALAGGPQPRRGLVEAGHSSAVLRGLMVAGVVAEVDAPAEPASDGPCRGHVRALSPQQQAAAAALGGGSGFSVTLLEGVTGSGKTEVYLEAIATTLAAGRQALVLMPEIALTPAVTARLAERFGREPGTWHSERPPAARVALWRDAATGAASVVVGARSALFLPFNDLGLVVVDEEHDASFKQEDGVIYHARDMAVARGRAANAPVVLASATPSVETRLNAERGRYRRLVLPSRHHGTALPDVAAVDLRRTPPPRAAFLSPPVRAAVTAALAAGEQALLFLNRRGYAPLTVCRRCGHRFHCPNCAASLVDHRLRGTLVCHHCGHDEARPTACPACDAADTLVPCGPGVERVEEEARALWPDARLEVLSSDVAGGARALTEALVRVERGEADVVVGTQLVAKGFTFPKLQCVVVVDADLGLHNGDPRAAERTFQLLTQVTGRAGRVSAGGRALLQTHAPDHPVMRAMVSGDVEAFYGQEAATRRDGGLPPFQRLAAVIVSAPDKADAHAHAAELARTAPHGAVEVLGPAEAPLAVLRGRWRYRLLVRAARTVPLQEVMVPWLAAVPVRGGVRRAVDVDPQSFL